MPQVYTVDLAGMECVPPEWFAVLDDNEIGRADRFQRSCDRLAFVAAHALKRLALAQAFPDRSAMALQFGTDTFGKPFLTDGGTIQFNLSHTTGLIALAVSCRAPVGVDVEALGAAALSRDAMLSVLHATERAALACSVDWEGDFLALWTAKEAVIKAEGKGLLLPLSEIEVHQDHARGPSRYWTLWRCRPTSRHVLALAWDGKDAVETHPLCGDDLTAWIAQGADPGRTLPAIRETFFRPDHRGYRYANLH